MAQDKKENKSKSHLESLSNKELDAMYASMARSTGTGEPNSFMQEIEQIMEKRYDGFHSESKKKAE